MRWLIVATIAVLATAGCRSDPDAKARAEKAGAARESAEWDKAFKDARRVEEKSRQRAEKQRQQMLDKANKEAEKE
jgi:hypothetical protein